MLKKIHIKNFKSIKDTIINNEPDYNVFIGENNVGKTSIFEAIYLWKRCYETNVKQKNDGFYSQTKNLLFKNLETIRVIHDKDIFPSDEKVNEIECEICLTFEIEDENFDLGFIISKTTTIDDAYLQVKYLDKEEFKRFSDKISGMRGYNVSNVISINESKPIANLVANEPKMTTAEIRDKIAKGKGHEVLRNKIISNEGKIAEHIEYITGRKPQFTSNDKKAYIEMKVDNKDILSYGSGFIQLVELFSSIEYTDSLIKILLIDEPDAHIHVKTQRQLVERLQSLSGYQLFIISHNERFVNETQDSKLFYIKDLNKKTNNISHIDPNTRPLLIEGLTGIVDELDQWKTAQKIILVEGSTDESFFTKLISKYGNITRDPIPTLKFNVLGGIDTLYSKLKIITGTMNKIVPNKKWLLVRDTDCYPISKLESLKRKFKNPINRDVDFDIIFQNGYGIESTYMTDSSILARILHFHYTTIEEAKILEVIRQINLTYKNDVNNDTSRIYSELKTHYDRQAKSREQLLNGIAFSEILSEITENNIQYIMTKEIAKWYYESIHNALKSIDNSITTSALNCSDVEKLYLDNLSDKQHFYPCHLELINEIRKL